MGDPRTDRIVAAYGEQLARHADGPETTRMSAAGQHFRFAKLMELDDLRGSRVLDLGCGIGEFYPLLRERFGDLDYHGVDITPGMIEVASRKYPEAQFEARDVLRDGLPGEYDHVLMSALFNDVMPDPTGYLRELVSVAFAGARRSIAFNFLSAHANWLVDDLSYHDPATVLDFSVRHLTRRVRMEHMYERADVAVFLYANS